MCVCVHTLVCLFVHLFVSMLCLLFVCVNVHWLVYMCTYVFVYPLFVCVSVDWLVCCMCVHVVFVYPLFVCYVYKCSPNCSFISHSPPLYSCTDHCCYRAHDRDCGDSCNRSLCRLLVCRGPRERVAGGLWDNGGPRHYSRHFLVRERCQELFSVSVRSVSEWTVSTERT